MIIFDLDGTLALCDHRRHFVTVPQKWNYKRLIINGVASSSVIERVETEEWKKFKPDWQAFYEACDKDEPNKPIIHILEYIGEGKEHGSDTPFVDYEGIQIWSGRCESVRKKTETWLRKHVRYYRENCPVLKMRPIRDSTPDEILKERWLDEYIASGGDPIEMVFDDRQKVVDMWRRRGITCLQVAEGDF